jgi:alpha-galactosidase
MNPRITVVGGGSTHWTPRLLSDFANTPTLHDADVVLVDIDADSLPPMLDVADHIAKCRPGIGLTASATTDLDEGLDGADYVVTAFSVGGFDSMRHDLEIPARYGIRQPVGDSVGPGGISRALRSIPVLVKIARAVERRCPNALLLNVTNPLSAVCRAVTHETEVRTVGLCNEVIGLQFVTSLLLDADLRHVDPVVAGVNHLPLVTSLRVGDDDGFASLRTLLADEEAQRAPVWMTPPAGMHYRKVSPGPAWTKADVIAGNRLKLELFTQFGVLPGSSDTHVAEFFPGFVTPSSDYGREWSVHHYGLQGHMADKADDDAEVAALLASDDLSTFPSGELVAPLLDSILSRTPRPLPVNVINRGQVQNLPDGVIVECIGLADDDGDVAPRDRAQVPSMPGEQLRRVAVAEELTVEAALTGNRTTVLEAMLADPMAGRLPYEHVVAMTDELLTATAPWLPQFAAS